MGSVRRYKVLVGSLVVYSGPMRTANIVFRSIRRGFPDALVTLAFDL